LFSRCFLDADDEQRRAKFGQTDPARARGSHATVFPFYILPRYRERERERARARAQSIHQYYEQR
jgi:hypothetical protein